MKEKNDFIESNKNKISFYRVPKINKYKHNLKNYSPPGTMQQSKVVILKGCLNLYFIVKILPFIR